jgi:predicted DCC family thiol-disulfide oxidoreductase YuxK
MIQSNSTDQTSRPIVLYDGVCGLCNRLVRFVLKRDRSDKFRFAALQSDFARNLLKRHNQVPDALDTFYLVLDHSQPTERLLTRSKATIAVLEEFGGVWRLWGKLLRLVPRHFRDWQYNLVASNRYRLFGRYEACPLPDPKVRYKFLDQT